MMMMTMGHQVEDNKKMKDFSDIIGHNFLSMIVIRRATPEETPWKSHETPFVCHCNKCGREWIARKSALIKGCIYCDSEKPTGRGYVNRGMIGQRFGYLTVLEQDKTIQRHQTYWKCKCDCGNIISVRTSHLLGKYHARTISCGCKQKSSGELQIKQILIRNNINFKEQYALKDFNTAAYFDFAIFNKENNLKCLIEFDGKQHYEPVEKFGGAEQFKIQIIRDQRKNNYCKEHNIRLIRIPYTDQSKLDNDKYLLDLINM